jgi:deoxyuridine 5'-triphosphate nucleotidohydrolase
MDCESYIKTYANGDKYWYLDGERHRTDGPAVEYANGYKEWYLDGKRHRAVGPAVEWANGDKEWWLNGKLHRTDGPAVEYANGYKAWYLDDKLHREDGPAAEDSSGVKYWYLNGKQFSKQEFHNYLDMVFKEKSIVKVRIHRLCKDNPLPSQANPGDAGWDVYAAKGIGFSPGVTKLVPLGIIAEAPAGYHFKLCIRSSLAYKKGFILANSLGIIDSTYAGETDEIQMILTLNGSKYVFIKKGDRVGQLILEKNNDIEWDEQENADFNKTSRGGIGSTGK